MLSGIPSMPYQLVKEELVEDSLLGQNLVKDALQGTLLVKGSFSGKRSCIIEEKGCKLRLKGCGNGPEKGFDLLPIEFKEDSQEIRGCVFHNSAFREQYFCNFIQKSLKEATFIPIANTAYRVLKYSDNLSQESDEVFVNEYPQIQKYCSVFKTLGDKRLGTHLL